MEKHKYDDDIAKLGIIVYHSIGAGDEMSMNANFYEQDFYALAMKNAELVRQGKLAEIDAEHVAEELEGMSRSERRD